MKRPKEYLLIADDSADIELITEMLMGENGAGINIKSVNRLSDGIKYLSDANVDVVMWDFILPDGQRPQVFTRLCSCIPDIPIIILTDFYDEAIALEAIQNGVQDYLVKGQVTRKSLYRSIYYACERKHQENISRQEGEKKIEIIKQKQSNGRFNQWSMALEQSPASVVITNLEGAIEYVNPKFTQITGYSLDEVIGENSKILKSGYTSVQQYKNLWEKITSGKEWKGEFFNKKKNGELFWEYVSISSLKTKKGVPVYYIAVKEDVAAHKEYEKLIEHQANYDRLTGLPNRVLAFDRLKQSLARAHRRKSNKNVAVMFIDLDQFKIVNDTLGHSIGDELLIEAASRLTATIRESDTVARLGGDEYLIILPDINNMNEAAIVAKKILDAFSVPFILNGHEIFVTASIGITGYPYDGNDPDTLLRNADATMYQAKEASRNTFRFFTHEMNKNIVDRIELETHLRHALERDEMILHYQPIIDIKTEKLVGVEALLRWDDPDIGFVFPEKFIHLAEETGLIVPIGEWAILTACKQVKSWQRELGSPICVAVNVSSRQFKTAGLLESIVRALKESGLSAECLELEITEGILLEEEPMITDMLKELKMMGVKLAIDDFGTGYSALSYLKKFSFDILKIDRTFIHEVNVDHGNAALSTAIIAMAHSLGMKVVAEGIGVKEQIDFLQSHDCDMAQGFFFSRALSAEEFIKFAKKHF